MENSIAKLALNGPHKYRKYRPTLMTQISSQLVFIVLFTTQALCCSRCSMAHEHEHHGEHGRYGKQDHQHGDAARASDQAESDQKQTPLSSKLKRIPLTGPSVEAFQLFPQTVSARVDGSYLAVESNGMPDHNMMVGIQSWQQQVPLPQPFVGENAWRLPMKPRFASSPISVLEKPLRGAIALAVNGVPIFSALNNRGDDTYLAGELDEWGGHCGRGDDYHYHTAPVHLEDIVGVGNPIAYALDGYPILGLLEADGSLPKNLDEFNGHKDADGNYHYHASQAFPYVNGGLRGVVTMDGDQIKQPQDSPARPGQSPLPGATVTGFSQNGNQFDLEYELSGKRAHVKYSILPDDRVEFTYVEPSGDSSQVIYRRGKHGAGQSVVTYGIAILFLIGFLGAAVWGWKYWLASKSV